jgi:uncharacterized protein (TIGR04255 family)
MTRPPDLPNYAKPPIDEVAIGVQLAPINGWTEPYFGLFWSKVRDDYPKVQSQPRIEGPIENFNQAPSPVPQIQFLPPGGRSWYISQDDESLIQIQNNRFVQNWRRRQGDYPHFEDLKDRFWRSYNVFRDLISVENLPTPVIQQLELSYINWIQDIPVDEYLKIGQASYVTVEDVDSVPETQDWGARYQVRSAGEPVARLYVQCQQAIRVGNPHPGAGTQLSLVYRAPFDQGMSDDQLEDHLEKGRSTIVRTFTEITTEPAQLIWERIQ